MLVSTGGRGGGGSGICSLLPVPSPQNPTLHMFMTRAPERGVEVWCSGPVPLGKVPKGGGAGYRSLCLLHAKQALYHLSYTPFQK